MTQKQKKSASSELYQKSKRRREYCKQWCKDNKDRLKELGRIRREKEPWRRSYDSARIRSHRKGIEFSITLDWCKKNWTGRCCLSDLPFELHLSTISPMSPSLDRIDPSLGYTEENSRFILMGVNALKGAGTDIEMYRIAQAIIKRKGTTK